jgi:hypothetical protein
MRTKRLVALLACLAVGAAGTLLSVSPSAGAADEQITLIAQTGYQDFDHYFELAGQANQPADYVSPNNYRDGRLYWRLDVTAKPSNKNVIGQLCFWRHGTRRFQYETCSPSSFDFSTEGTYYFDAGAPGSWWKLNGNYNWSLQASVIRFMLKDPVSGKLLFSKSCGNACYPNPEELLNHVPVDMRLEVVMVSKGTTFTPPTNWRQGCPKAWSPLCSGSGGGGGTTTTTEGATTTTTRATTTTQATTTTTRPTTSTTQGGTTSTTQGGTLPSGSVPAPPQGGGARVVVIAGSTSASGDANIVGTLADLGYDVDVVDVDVLEPGDLDGAAAAVVTSSIVPSALPAWLADLELPMLVSEAYVMDDLGMASSGSDGPNRTSLALTGHPVGAGLQGTLQTSGPSPYVVAEPGPGAGIVATAGGDVAVYAYEDGATMAAGTAPARRVGWFYSYETAKSTTADADRLLGHAVGWLVDGGGPTLGDEVVLLTNTGGLASGDRAIAQVIEDGGHELTVVAESELTRSRAAAADAVVISSSVLPGEVPTFLRTLETPLLASEPFAFDELALATGVGEVADQRTIVVDGADPVASGFAGNVTIATEPVGVNVGSPGPGADVVATTSSGRPTLFRYDAGAALTDGAAPARRVAFFMSYDGAREATPAAVALLANALEWVLG